MTVIVANWPETNATSYSYVYGSPYYSFGQALKGTGGNVISSASFYLAITQSNGRPHQTIHVEIWSHAGVYGNGGKPDALLAQADTRDSYDFHSQAPGHPYLETFTFSGANKIRLENEVPYYLVIRAEGGQSGSSICIYYDDSSPYFESGKYAYTGSVLPTTNWFFYYEIRSLTFYLYQDDPPPAIEGDGEITLLPAAFEGGVHAFDGTGELALAALEIAGILHNARPISGVGDLTLPAFALYGVSRNEGSGNLALLMLALAGRGWQRRMRGYVTIGAVILETATLSEGVVITATTGEIQTVTAVLSERGDT
jgi:hypothetical protein